MRQPLAVPDRHQVGGDVSTRWPRATQTSNWGQSRRFRRCWRILPTTVTAGRDSRASVALRVLARPGEPVPRKDSGHVPVARPSAAPTQRVARRRRPAQCELRGCVAGRFRGGHERSRPPVRRAHPMPTLRPDVARSREMADPSTGGPLPIQISVSPAFKASPAACSDNDVAPGVQRDRTHHLAQPAVTLDAQRATDILAAHEQLTPSC
jgi:hypothetical protein